MKLPHESSASSRQGRSAATQNALMRAAEKLFADHGMESVSIRDIVSAAGQKNESALQYHFNNVKGLIDAIHQQRSAETQAERSRCIAEMLAHSPEPKLRQICVLMVQPAFDLARSSIEFRNYVKAFGHELALSEASALSIAANRGGAGGASGEQVAKLLRKTLSHLNPKAYRSRMETAVRLCSASMYHQARQKNAFRGATADYFLNSLLDSLVGLLGAPESNETKAVARSLQTK